MNNLTQKDSTNPHRFGWNYVLDNIESSESGIYLDSYVDNTFAPNAEPIVYQKPWIGVIHHTFTTQFGEKNCVNLFKNPYFLESLKNCKSLIVMSNYLKDKVKCKLDEISRDIPVHYITHPTGLNVPEFKLELFLKNQNKQLVHIGQWMRNIWSFYDLQIDSITLQMCLFSFKTFKINKTILGKHLEIPLTRESPDPSDYKINCHSSDNSDPDFQFKDFIESKLKSVKCIPKLNDLEFDKLLTENIVFIHLVDCSAVNTLIECIVRNTPIIINDHPAVVELLGVNYPLYFKENKSITLQVDKMLNGNAIKRSHEHLKKIDNKKFDIARFVESLNKLI